MTHDFEDIRPFTDAEVPDAIRRLLQEPALDLALDFAFPHADKSKLKLRLSQIQTVAEFQSQFIAQTVHSIERGTTQGIEVFGLQNLKPNQAYLFLSNHRDIVLDSAFINYILHREGFPTTRIAIGDNLLQKAWIADLVRLNKNFIVHRNIAPRQAYSYSHRLSSYIKHSIAFDGASVWIAQREGRTKDGWDKTHAGLLKMMALSHEDGPVAAFEALHLVPVSIAYEWEPCDGLKARENWLKARDGKYEKQPGEDLISMKTGMASPKGKVRIHFGNPLVKNDLEQCFNGRNTNDGFRELGALIDRFVSLNYHLSPSNFIAWDLLNRTSRFTSHYTNAQKEDFLNHMQKQLASLDILAEDGNAFFLAIYANPLEQKLQLDLLS